ncbi:MotA/TolQ/ExbB proton channel family protein [Vibrio gangliei]|uniref:MotA/TolQ/ExbB proton channel family protein n=1 Tax=Vibrio gangliei TaxID=2077090 RepID=UPI0014764520|nr:MotA/TolQ/ExbB proton channel family protein [Vibrio gangliei]
MSLKSSAVLLALLTATFTVSADDLSNLDNKAKADQQVENTHNQQRVQLSAEQRAALQAKRDQLSKQLAQIEKENAQLSDTFAANEEILAEKSKDLQLATGSLGELFGVVRQAAKDVQLSYESSFLGEQGKAFDAQLNKVISTDSLPSLKLLNGLWHAMQYKVETGSQVTDVTIPFVQGDGKTQQAPAIRIGDMALLTEQGYVKWDFTRQQAANYLALPSNAPTLSDFTSNAGQSLLIDPTRGVMLEQYAHQPTLMQRIDQAGVVGKVIIALLIIGLIIALVRGVRLGITQQQISKQLKQPENPTDDNPLGRILHVYNKEKKQSVESLELRLLESILDEQQGLERGLSMLKLFAALAPMLGLLGTVTGMIETFQVITQFGNGDPKVMAGGISMALITTVLGLVAAMPLLLAHNVLSNRAEVIRNTLEKQGVSLVARRAEAESDAQLTGASA